MESNNTGLETSPGIGTDTVGEAFTDKGGGGGDDGRFEEESKRLVRGSLFDVACNRLSRAFSARALGFYIKSVIKVEAIRGLYDVGIYAMLNLPSSFSLCSCTARHSWC